MRRAANPHHVDRHQGNVSSDMVAPDKVLHITRRGARVTHIKAVNAVRFYEVVENESELD